MSKYDAMRNINRKLESIAKNFGADSTIMSDAMARLDALGINVQMDSATGTYSGDNIRYKDGVPQLYNQNNMLTRTGIPISESDLRDINKSIKGTSYYTSRYSGKFKGMSRAERAKMIEKVESLPDKMPKGASDDTMIKMQDIIKSDVVPDNIKKQAQRGIDILNEKFYFGDTRPDYEDIAELSDILDAIQAY